MRAKKRTKEELEQLKSWAQTLITKDKVTQKEAAERVGVSAVTMNKWYLDGNWEKLQKNFLLTREEQMGKLLNELSQLNGYIETKPEGFRWADNKEADIRRKLIKDLKELETKAALAEIIHSCHGLLEFVRKIDLDAAQKLSDYVDGYIKSRL